MEAPHIRQLKWWHGAAVGTWTTFPNRRRRVAGGPRRIANAPPDSPLVLTAHFVDPDQKASHARADKGCSVSRQKRAGIACRTRPVPEMSSYYSGETDSMRTPAKGLGELLVSIGI